jgi:simple sugar transport system substrate-binding protein
MRKAICAILILAVSVCALASCSGDKEDPAVKIGIINNPPGESGYREANVLDFERVFSGDGSEYSTETFYSGNHNEQLTAARKFIEDGVDYLLISAASSDGWDSVLRSARDAGIRIFLFDRMINTSDDLYEAAVISDMAFQGDLAVNWLKNQNLASYNVVHIQGSMGTDAQFGRTAALDKEFASGAMNKVEQQSATWNEDTAKKIVADVISTGAEFNVIYAENTGMARGAVAALTEAGISHGIDGDVIIMAFDADRWALRLLLAGEWNYIGECSPFQASVIDGMIKTLREGGTLSSKIVISEEQGFDAKTVTQADIDSYGLGE